MTPAWRRFERNMAESVERVMDGAPPRIPDGGAELFGLFLDLCAGRQIGAHGPQAIPATEIEATARLARVVLAPRHVAVLRAMDAAWLAKAMQKVAKGTGDEATKALPPKSDHALTPLLFDTVF